MIEIYNYKVNFNNFFLFIPELVFATKGQYLIIGENGSGKTTFIRSILNIFKDYEGEILINKIENKKLSRKEIASIISYLPQQDSSVFFSIKVKDFIETGLYSAKDNFFDLIIDILELKSYLDKDYNSLSGGERQLVRIARAMVGNVNFYLLDEPDTFLSKKNKEKIKKLFNEISKEKTLIIISHSNRDFNDIKTVEFENYIKEC